MIWLLTLDNEPDDRTDEHPKSAYLSRKDLRILAIVGVLFVLIMLPIYGLMKRKTEQHVCLTNMSAIGKAMMLYASQNNDMLPPTHVVAHGPTGAPLIENGQALTWVTLVSDYMNKRNDFICPSAQEAEGVVNAGDDPKTGRSGVVSHYGMYAPYGGYPHEFVDRANEVVLFSETSNRGARDTFDPVPFLDAEGKPAAYDGFVIGWNTGNFEPKPDTKSVTRLAFFNTKDGVFTVEKPARHDEGLHFIYMDLHYEIHRAPAAEVRVRVAAPEGRWAIPPVSGPGR